MEQDRDETAVSGTRTEVESFAERIRRRKAVVFYIMNRAEHCRRMVPLAKRLLRDAYAGMVFKDPEVTLLADNGNHLRTGEQVRTDLAHGWARPLMAEELYRELANLRVGTIVAPTARGMFTDFGEGRFKIEKILPNAMVRKLRGDRMTIL